MAPSIPAHRILGKTGVNVPRRAIGILERDQWLACMDQAMGEMGVPADLRERLKNSFFQTADWMRNQSV